MCIFLSGEEHREHDQRNSRDYRKNYKTIKKPEVLIVTCAPGAKSAIYDCLAAAKPGRDAQSSPCVKTGSRYGIATLSQEKKPHGHRQHASKFGEVRQYK